MLASAGKSYVIRPGETPEIVATNDLGEENRASAAVSCRRARESADIME